MGTRALYYFWSFFQERKNALWSLVAVEYGEDRDCACIKRVVQGHCSGHRSNS